MNPSLSEDSVAETALAKQKNSDGKSTVWHPVKSKIGNWRASQINDLINFTGISNAKWVD